MVQSSLFFLTGLICPEGPDRGGNGKKGRGLWGGRGGGSGGGHPKIIMAGSRL